MKKREINIDLIRCIATASVLSVHFFLNSEYYSVDIIGKNLFVMTIMRTIFMVCVPLFLIITGYLMNTKNLSKKYYIGICHTISIYVIISLFCCLFKLLYLHEEMGIKDIVIQIFNFSAAPYAWYIEMYIGLYILIPFLNILYHNINGKKEKRVLIATVGVLVTLPSLLNMYHNIQIVPDWWQSIWPILYYFIGCYIKEYDVKIPLKINLITWIGIILVSGGINIYRSYNTHFLWEASNDWFGWENVCSSVFLFILIKNLKLNNISNTIKGLITFTANISLGIYLSSWIMDKLLYGILNSAVPDVRQRMKFSILIVPLVFVGAAFMSGLSECIYKGGKRIIGRVSLLFSQKYK